MEKTFKRILSLLLTLAMVIGMTVPTVFADETETTPEKTPAQIGAEIAAAANAMEFPESGNYVAMCPACGVEVTWKPMAGNADGVGYATTANAHWYLTRDLSTTGWTAPLHVTEYSCVHLNGHNIYSAKTAAINCTVRKDTTIPSTLNLFGSGNISGQSSNQYLPAALSLKEGSTANLYGGTMIAEADVTTKAPLIVLGGSNLGTVNMYAGTLDGNNVQATDVPGCVLLGNKDAAFNMYGGTIQNGSSKCSGANVIITNGVFNMYGGTIKDGNSTLSGGNLSANIQESGGFNMYGGTIEGGSSVSGGNLVVHKGTINMYGGTVRNGVTTTRGGNLYVSGGVFNAYGGTISGGKATSTSSAGGNVVIANGTFNLDGATVVEGTAVYGGNIAAVKDPGNEDAVPRFIMESGTLEGFGSKVANYNKYGGSIYIIDGVCTINGGSITKGYGEFRGGNLYVPPESTAEVTINGGTFTYGYASAGGNVAAYGPVTINGGSFSISTSTNNNIAVYGETTINNATVTKGTITKAKVSGAEGAAPVIHHGSFTMDPSAFLATGAAVYGSAPYMVHKSVEKVATEATCTEPALAAHTGCAGCDLVLKDDAWLTHEEAGVITAAAHTRTLVEATPSTCTAVGNKAYYACSCGKSYEDAEASVEIADLAAWKAGEGALESVDHEYVYTYKSATAHTVTCANCETVFEDGTHDTKTAACDQCGAKKIAGTILRTRGVENFRNTVWEGQPYQMVAIGGSGLVSNENNNYKLEWYCGDQLLLTSQCVGLYLQISVFLTEKTDGNWVTTYADGVTLSDENVPTKMVLYVDGVEMDTYGAKGYEGTIFYDKEAYNAYLNMSYSGHVHTLGEAVETTPATCTAPGESAQTCSVCDAVVKTPIEQLNHSYTGENGVCVNGCENTKCDNEGHKYDKQVADAEKYLATEATCTAAATYYYSCECGVAGTETFEYGTPVAHTFDKQVTTDEYLASAATHAAAATYYYSCECGAEGEETFSYGDPVAHAFDKQVTTDEYLASAATHAAAATYYYSCECGAKGEETFSYGDPVAHTFDKQVTTDEYLASAATHAAAATYYYSCECGAKGEETFSYGDPVAHTYDQQNTDAKYLKDAATCTAAATYYYSCECGVAGTETFTYGELAAHTLTYVPQQPATVYAEGYEAYYKCDCGALFADEKGEVSITEPVAIPKLTVETVLPSEEELTEKVESGETLTEEQIEEVKQQIIDVVQNSTQIHKVEMPADHHLQISFDSVAVKDQTVTKWTYDVTPMKGTEVVEKLDEAITFYLPIPTGTGKTTAAVFHDGKLFDAEAPIVEENGEAYVVVTSSEFSPYTVDLEFEAVADVGGTSYGTLQEALTAAYENNGGVVVLEKSVSVAGLDVPANVTLDLNGLSVTVTGDGYAIALYDASYIMDSSENNAGRLVVDISHLRLLDENAYLPVDMGNGIMFVEAVSGQGKNYKADSVYQCWMGDDTDVALMEALKTTDASDLGLKFQVIVSWGTIQLKHTFSDETVKAYAQDWTKLAMYLKLVGAEGINDLTYQARIVFAEGTEAEVLVWAGAEIPHYSN